MIKPLNWLMSLLLGIYVTMTTADEKFSPNQKKAMQTLVQAIQKTNVYKDRHRIECLDFFPETNDQKHIIIAIHEKHSEICGGDKQTWPIVDRFKIVRPYSNMKQIEWLNPADEENLNFQTYAKKSIKNDYEAHSD